MQQQLKLRPLQYQDYIQIQEIIRKVWAFDKDCSPKVAKRLARAYLAKCLTNQTFAQVAVIDNKVVGVIMGNNLNKHKSSWQYSLYAMYTNFLLLLTAEGRAVAKFFYEVEAIYRKLLRNSKYKYSAELSFFAVEPAYQGMSIGKKLYNSFKQYLQTEELTNFYLYTDSDCNFNFYEKQGLKRRKQIQTIFRLEKEIYPMHFFLYDCLSLKSEKSYV